MYLLIWKIFPKILDWSKWDHLVTTFSSNNFFYLSLYFVKYSLTVQILDIFQANQNISHNIHWWLLGSMTSCHTCHITSAYLSISLSYLWLVVFVALKWLQIITTEDVTTNISDQFPFNCVRYSIFTHTCAWFYVFMHKNGICEISGYFLFIIKTMECELCNKMY
jgi:hypothetical protein